MAYFTWATIERGDDIPEGAVLGGNTSTDGEVFVGRNTKHGEPGKLNLKNGKMWNLWCHAAKDSPHGEILIVHPGVEVLWIPVCKGDPLPRDAVYAGRTKTDGPLFVCRTAGITDGSEGGSVGKLNLSDDENFCYNMWFHQDWQDSLLTSCDRFTVDETAGSVLVVGEPGAALEWVERFENFNEERGRDLHGPCFTKRWIKQYRKSLDDTCNQQCWDEYEMVIQRGTEQLERMTTEALNKLARTLRADEDAPLDRALEELAEDLGGKGSLLSLTCQVLGINQQQFMNEQAE